MNRVLVVVASRHGSTRGIAEAIAGELRAAGLAADLRGADEVASIDGYGAVVLGSAVYIGNWLPAARQFVKTHRSRLVNVPVWLFSSGPLGDERLLPEGNPARVDEIVAETGAREHRIFAGRIDRTRLGVGERLIVRMVRAPEGDFRDWVEIRDWARQIAGSLMPTVTAERDASLREDVTA